MIVVTGVIEIAEGDAEAAKAAALEMAAETQAEKGCIEYEFWQALDAPGRLHVYEEWESLAALDAHGKSAHMARFREALGKLNVISRDVRRMEAGPPTPL